MAPPCVSRDEAKQSIALLGVCPIRIPDPRGDCGGSGCLASKGIRMCTSHRLDRMTSNSTSAHFDEMSHLLVLGMPFAFADGRIVTRVNLASAKVTAEEAVKVLDKL